MSINTLSKGKQLLIGIPVVLVIFAVLVIGLLWFMDNGAKRRTAQTNYPTADKPKSGELADRIIGTWETQGKDKARFTFGKDGNLVVKAEESATQNAIYSVLDADAIEVKAEGKPKLVILIKINGDTMIMNTQNRGSETLKRVG